MGWFLRLLYVPKCVWQIERWFACPETIEPKPFEEKKKNEKQDKSDP